MQNRGNPYICFNKINQLNQSIQKDDKIEKKKTKREKFIIAFYLCALLS